MTEEKTHTLDAVVTVMFTIENICESNYNEDEDMCFEDMVKDKLDWEGLYNFLDEDDYEVIEVKKIQ